jgi:hypothetical protein
VWQRAWEELQELLPWLPSELVVVVLLLLLARPKVVAVQLPHSKLQLQSAEWLLLQARRISMDASVQKTSAAVQRAFLENRRTTAAEVLMENELER